MYFFENRRFVIFISKDVLKPNVFQLDVLKTGRFENLKFRKSDI
jgi:hypothetical protein